MAGVKGRSGKRDYANAPSTPAPKLEPSHESIQAFVAWTAEQLATGAIDPAVADRYAKLAREMTVSLRARHQEGELEQAKQVLKKIEAAKAYLKRKLVELRGRGIEIDMTDAETEH